MTIIRASLSRKFRLERSSGKQCTSLVSKKVRRINTSSSLEGRTLMTRPRSGILEARRSSCCFCSRSHKRRAMEPAVDKIAEFLAAHDWGLLRTIKHWQVERDEVAKDIVRLTLRARDDEEYIVRFVCDGYPGKAPRVAFVNA